MSNQQLRLFYFIILLFISQKGFPQQRHQRTIDSLLLADRQFPTDDRARVERYEQLLRFYGKLGREDMAEAYANKAIRLAEQLKLHNAIGDTYYHLGFFYQSHGNFIKAEEIYNKGIRKARETGYKQLYGDIYYNMGAMYASWPDYNKALNANLEAVAVYHELGDTLDVAGCYENIAACYKQLEQYKTAISYLEQAARIFRHSQGEEYGLALCYADLGANYCLANENELGITKEKKYQQARDYLSRSLELASPIGDPPLMSNIYRTRSMLFNRNGMPAETLEALQQAIVYDKLITNRQDYATDLLSLADFYIAHQQYNEASPLLQEALKIGTEHNFPLLQRDANLALSSLAEKQQHFIKALEHFKAYISFRDQVFNAEKEKEITRKRLQLDFLIKENDYKNKQQLMNLALQKRTLEAREQKQELELKENEIRIEKLAFLQRQASLEKEKLQQAGELERQRLNARLDKKSSDEKILKEENKTRLNRNLAIFLGILTLALSGAALLVYRAQQKTKQLNLLVLSQKAALEELGKVKDRILGIVSHDMRAPVNSLISFTRLLEHGNLPEEKLKAYTLSLSQTLGHTSSMMENLLNWAYSQMQGFRPDLKIFQPGPIVQELVASAGRDAALKNLDLSFTQEAGVMAYGDMNMLSLIVRNLLNNAIKFTRDGGRIAVSIEQSAQHIKIYIADTGVGLEEKQLQMFNSNTGIQPGRSTAGTNSEKGMGLGLTLCKAFATMMHAQLTAIPNGSQGTIFVLAMLCGTPIGYPKQEAANN
ncbi:tetratricopeptide repeat-containing sensor histidine kinase [Chitinophaga sp. Cy-1792]|uniref:ATP-binding protein n=1 Tax=Chitinophaga sp. Cy-1792 TaxID=2608339 RepID=UPI00141D95B2|nr:tetratricopeptide repeat-containing sensor histidine kinase [Chitinophaga sp. Cy-1792]NIG54502.1 hypothetical protein [Chitinophaga sp. Cy-1792]